MGTNDKGRLTEEEIEKMIREAEEFAEEDKMAKERIDARNAFDGYIHSMKSAIEGSGDNKGLGEKMDEDEKGPSTMPSRMGRIGSRVTRRPTRRRSRKSRRKSRESALRSSRSTTRAPAAAAVQRMTTTM